MYLLARLVGVRRVVRSLAGRRAQPLDPHRSSVFDADVARVADAIRRNGFDATLRLPPAIVQELAELGKGVTSSSPYSVRAPETFPTVEMIATDGKLRELAALYLGGDPVYQGSRLWWTRPDSPGDPRETGARFHYDLYDYRALIFLFYLTDVGPDAGPHVCVRASHRLRTWRDQLHPRRHRSDEDVRRGYGLDRIVTICGPAGTTIAEDPFCFHKARPPTARDRFALQILFTGGDFPAPSFRRAGVPRGGDEPRSPNRD